MISRIIRGLVVGFAFVLAAVVMGLAGRLTFGAMLVIGAVGTVAIVWGTR